MTKNIFFIFLFLLTYISVSISQQLQVEVVGEGVQTSDKKIVMKSAMVPIILFVKVNDTSIKQISWQFSSDNISVVKYPQGSNDLSQIIITPILSKDEAVDVENDGLLMTEVLKDNWVDLVSGGFTMDNLYYDYYQRPSIADRNQTKTCPAGWSYIVVMGLEAGDDFVIVSDYSSHKNNSEDIIFPIKFTERKINISADLKISGGPEESPTNLAERNAGATIHIINESNVKVDLHDVVLKYEDVGDWWSGGPIYKRVSDKKGDFLLPDEKRNVEFSDIGANSKITGSKKDEIKALKTKVTALYPNALNDGTTAEIDFTHEFDYTRPPAPPVLDRDLAGIETFLRANILMIKETSGEPNATLDIIAVKECGPTGSIVSGGNITGRHCARKKGDAINIQYRLYSNNKVIGTFPLKLEY